ncbi:MAG TPA: ATP-binding protein [Rhizomicrobium sp.]|nr:ATP-binding protein [Rhizomicrobium sp.]
MLRWLDFRASNAIVPTIALFGAVAISLAGTFGSLYEDKLYKAQKIREATIEAKILAASVSAALSFNDRRTAQQYVNALAANPDLVSAAVFDAHGATIAQFSRGWPPARIPPPRRPESAIDGNRIVVAAPVSERGQTLGMVYLSSSMDSLRRRFLKYAAIALVAAMAATLLAVLATAQRALTLANRKLQKQARDLSQANANLQREMRERAKVEEALRQSQKMEAVGQLSGGIAHDFNNFLMIIKGNLHLIKRRIAQGQTDVGKYIDSAIEGADRAASVTQRVLAFSRRQPLSPEPLNLSGLVSAALPLIRQSVGGQVAVECDLRADWWVYCDANQMENVLINLAINARDAMPNGGKLSLSTRNVRMEELRPDDVLPGEYAELVVRDSGVGMTEEVRVKALDPFFTTKPHGKGTGLGLSMSFGFIRQSAGYLDIESETGQGTAVRILLPRRYVNSMARRS